MASPLKVSDEGVGLVVQHGTGGEALIVEERKLYRTFSRAISVALLAAD
jgi:hypothetical protein